MNWNCNLSMNIWGEVSQFLYFCWCFSANVSRFQWRRSFAVFVICMIVSCYFHIWFYKLFKMFCSVNFLFSQEQLILLFKNNNINRPMAKRHCRLCTRSERNRSPVQKGSVSNDFFGKEAFWIYTVYMYISWS